MITFYCYFREPNATTIVQETVSGVSTKTLRPGDPIRTKLADILKRKSVDGQV